MSLRWNRGLVSLAAAAILAFIPDTARADLDLDLDVTRIAAVGHSLKWNWTPPGKGDRFGHGEVLINAPLEKVRSIVTDYAHYHDLAPDKIRTTRIIAKHAGSTDVYTQVPILDGTIMAWYVVRFSPLKEVKPGTEVIEGTMVKGNISAMNSIWTMRAVNDQWTVLKLDLLGTPGVPVPQAWIDEGLRDAAVQSVDAVHDRAQGDAKWVPWVPGATNGTSADAK